MSRVKYGGSVRRLDPSRHLSIVRRLGMNKSCFLIGSRPNWEPGPSGLTCTMVLAARRLSARFSEPVGSPGLRKTGGDFD
jgi:hypothetical protein